MTLNKEFFERETNITAKVICDSISEQGVRLTTFEIEYPRIIMSEFNTHRAISRNSSSSRAIPTGKMLEHTKNINLKPVYFGSKKAGMQAGDELEGEDLQYAKDVWESALKSAVAQADLLDDCGVAKEVTNRLVEPFQLVKVVCTSTDWDNFFNLRLHPDADPNICMLAYKMYKSLQESTPFKLKDGEWHLPYVTTTRDNEGKIMYVDSLKETHYVEYSLEQAVRISSSCCAQTSYRKTDDSLIKADGVFDKLVKTDVIHSSPMEHQATPIQESNYDYGVNELHPETWEEGVTHMNKQGQLCSGNLRGFIQYRHLLPNNTNWNFDFDKRMELFSD